MLTLVGGSEGARLYARSLEVVLLLGDDSTAWVFPPFLLLLSSRLESVSTSKRGVFGFVVVLELSDCPGPDREAAGEPGSDMIEGV